MKNKIKIILYVIVFAIVCYEGYYYITYKANSHIAVYGGELNKYKSDFVLSINGDTIDTLNANIPVAYSKGTSLSFGSNKIILKSLDSTKKFEQEIYFFGLFSWNVIEFVPEEIMYRRFYSFPTLE